MEVCSCGYAEQVSELEHKLRQAESLARQLATEVYEHKHRSTEYLRELCGLKAKLMQQNDQVGVYEEYAHAKALLEANGFKSTTRPITYGILCLLQQENTTRAKLYEGEASKIEEDEL